MVINTLKSFTKTILIWKEPDQTNREVGKQRFEQRNSSGLIKVNIDGGDMTVEQIGGKHVNEAF